MKVILFDLLEAQPALTSKFHGGGEYIKAVFKNLIEYYWNRYKIIVFYNKEKFLDAWIQDIIKKKKIKEYFIKDVGEIKDIFLHEKIDTFYSGLPYYYKKELIPNNVRIIGTIHGLRFLELPADKYAYLYTHGIARLKEKIRYLGKVKYQERKRQEFSACIDMLDDLVCVSNHTHFSILKYFPEQKDKKINVFYTPQKKAELCIQENSPFENKFILVMGGDRWIKNSYRTVIAIEKLFKASFLEEYKVVIIGGMSKSIQQKVSDLSKYIIKDYVESSELELLYKYCDLFVYASLNEGFGMPPLEAMKYGTTCVVSGVCSLPEICGDVVYYVNPYDVDEVAVRILNAIYIKGNSEKVKRQFDKIAQRQKKDLDKLCELIIS